jgi:uncharacterized protein YbbK (DUF523 family)
MKEKVLISACLIGLNCKYNGKNNYNEELINKLKEKSDLVPVCPEIMGGLQTPREPAEIKDGKVINKEGKDVTAYFKLGADETLKVADLFKANKAILKSKSPSCGKGKIYDGTFTGKLVKGNGITTDLLLDHEIEVISSEEI